MQKQGVTDRTTNIDRVQCLTSKRYLYEKCETLLITKPTQLSYRSLSVLQQFYKRITVKGTEINILPTAGLKGVGITLKIIIKPLHTDCKNIKTIVYIDKKEK